MKKIMVFVIIVTSMSIWNSPVHACGAPDPWEAGDGTISFSLNEATISDNRVEFSAINDSALVIYDNPEGLIFTTTSEQVLFGFETFIVEHPEGLPAILSFSRTEVGQKSVTFKATLQDAEYLENGILAYTFEVDAVIQGTDKDIAKQIKAQSGIITIDFDADYAQAILDYQTSLRC